MLGLAFGIVDALGVAMDPREVEPGRAIPVSGLIDPRVSPLDH